MDTAPGPSPAPTAPSTPAPRYLGILVSSDGTQFGALEAVSLLGFMGSRKSAIINTAVWVTWRKMLSAFISSFKPASPSAATTCCCSILLHSPLILASICWKQAASSCGRNCSL